MASLAEIKDVDILDVLEMTGTEHRNMGNRISFICPSHDDHKLGSCFAFRNNSRWKCYACGAGGDVIHLVQAIEGIDFKEACSWISRNCLGDDCAEIEYQKKKTLSSSLLQMIGLSPDDGPVYSSVNCYPDIFKGEDLLDGIPGKVTWHCAFPETDSDYVTVDHLVMARPLLELCNNEPEIYQDLIYRKACEASERYRDMLDAGIKQSDASEIERYCSRVAQLVGIPTWRKTIEEIIRKCEDLAIEFGNKTKEENPRKRKNVYASIRL